MTVDEMRQRREQIEEEQRALAKESSTLELEIEIAEGRATSRAARFARAHITGDLAAMNRVCAENVADCYQRTGRWDFHQAEAERILAETKSIAAPAPSPEPTDEAAAF